MRLLHTSDWHLGRFFHGEDLLPAQATFLDFLAETVRDEGVDVVLVSGDIFDRALPRVDAVSLLSDGLRRLVDAGAQVVAISGNHDSARRLGFGADLIAASGVHLRTDPAAAAKPVVLHDEHGPVAVYAVPYLEPDLTKDVVGAAANTHADVMAAAVRSVRADIDRRRGTRSVVLAHAFVSGGQTCESERDVSVGGVATVPLSTFDEMSYAALGHLHGRQTLADGVRYSGSPLAFSFSEHHHVKGCWLVDLGSSAVDAVHAFETPVPRRVARINGSLDDLLGSSQYSSYEDCWLHVTLTDAVRPREPMDRLRSRFPHTLMLTFAPAGVAGEQSASTYTARLQGRSDLDIALGFVEHVRQRRADDDERTLLDDAFAAVRAAETAI
ncbi:MAG: exonuclease SbcCD subunit D [Actinomycetes bacterium]